eukprot:TRINITY_DN65112_c0_g1_i1.p1 TRINITY_DN65112_c0_g1~~TRINITY_DN65112_c0_g1_i1.p1  ORF type:complete len:122 (+),score=8.70 TRINITY_DN65112_c0_g1_i1:23-388(+)
MRFAAARCGFVTVWIGTPYHWACSMENTSCDGWFNTPINAWSAEKWAASLSSTWQKSTEMRTLFSPAKNAFLGEMVTARWHRQTRSAGNRSCLVFPPTLTRTVTTETVSYTHLTLPTKRIV